MQQVLDTKPFWAHFNRQQQPLLMTLSCQISGHSSEALFTKQTNITVNIRDDAMLSKANHCREARNENTSLQLPFFLFFFLSIHLCKKLSEQESIVSFLFLVMTSTKSTCEGKTLLRQRHAMEYIIEHKA
jgi:hypothetical protein